MKQLRGIALEVSIAPPDALTVASAVELDPSPTPTVPGPEPSFGAAGPFAHISLRSQLGLALTVVQAVTRRVTTFRPPP